MTRFFCTVFCCVCFLLNGQDTLYARKTLKELTSKKYFGRGYVNNGVNKAAVFLSKEVKKNGALPLLKEGYLQKYRFSVNTFPGEVSLKVNGQELQPGLDFILEPASNNADGFFDMKRRDSVSWINENYGNPVVIVRKKKLTYSVATHTAPYTMFEVLESKLPAVISNVECGVEDKFLMDKEFSNVCSYIDGTKNNDSMVVFTAHYDHLGGMGKKTFFPGANDNASGTSLVLDLIRYYKKNPPKYKTVFIFFSGEEAGLLGSEYFVKNSPVDLKKIKFLINLDLLGTGDDGIMLVNGAILEKQFDWITNINKEKNYVKEIKKRGKAKNSDHYWFTEAGVPAFFLYTLGGVTYYHDVLDKAATLPLTDYCDVFRLLRDFVDQL